MVAVIESGKTGIPVYPLSQYSHMGSKLIEVLEAKGDTLRLTPDFLIPHRKDYYLLVLVKQGNSRHWVDAVPYTLKPDTFYFTIPTQVHLKEDTRLMQGLILCFTEELLRLEENQALKQLPILQNPADAHELNLRPKDLRFIEEIMLKMVEEFKDSNSWKNQMLTSLLRVLLIYLSRLYTEQFSEAAKTENHLLLKNFQVLVEQNYSTLHDVASYASLLHLTPGYLSDLVKQQSGKTVLAHIHERITVEAKRRLLHTELSVKELSDELGFREPAYFNRFFKRLTSTTPAAYRIQIRKMYS